MGNDSGRLIAGLPTAIYLVYDAGATWWVEESGNWRDQSLGGMRIRIKQAAPRLK